MKVNKEDVQAGSCVSRMQRDHVREQFHTRWNNEDRPLAPISSLVEA